MSSFLSFPSLGPRSCKGLILRWLDGCALHRQMGLREQLWVESPVFPGPAFCRLSSTGGGHQVGSGWSQPKDPVAFAGAWFSSVHTVFLEGKLRVYPVYTL